MRVATAPKGTTPRVRDGLPGAFVPDCQPRATALRSAGAHTNGNLRASVTADGSVRFERVSDGRVLASVGAPAFGSPKSANSSFVSYTVGVASGDPREKIYGMGELEGLPKREACDIGSFALPWARNGLNVSLGTAKFQVSDCWPLRLLRAGRRAQSAGGCGDRPRPRRAPAAESPASSAAQVSIPLAVSSRGYAMFFNAPGTGTRLCAAGPPHRLACPFRRGPLRFPRRLSSQTLQRTQKAPPALGTAPPNGPSTRRCRSTTGSRPWTPRPTAPPGTAALTSFTRTTSMPPDTRPCCPTTHVGCRDGETAGAGNGAGHDWGHEGPGCLTSFFSPK